MFCPNDRRHTIDTSLTQTIGAEQTEDDNKDLNDITYDSMGRMRVSMSETLISSDFNYGFGPGEWETVETVNNVPGVHYRYGDPKLSIQSILVKKDSTLVSIVFSAIHNMVSGDFIVITGSPVHVVNGVFPIIVLSDTKISFYASAKPTSTQNAYSSISTFVYRGRYYSGSFVNVRDIKSDEQQPRSKLTLITDNATGFAQGTVLTVTDTHAQAMIEFSAEDVEHQDVISSSNIVDCSASLGTGSYNHFPVIPFDWAAASVSYFSSSNVSVADDWIAMDGVEDDSDVMYWCPPWETEVGGLRNGNVYRSLVSGSNVQLRELRADLTSGFRLKRFVNVMDPLSDVSTSRYSTSTVQRTRWNNFPSESTYELYGVYLASQTKAHSVELATYNCDAVLWWCLDANAITTDNTEIVVKNGRRTHVYGSKDFPLESGQRYVFVCRFHSRRRGMFGMTIDGKEMDPESFFHSDLGTHTVGSAVSLTSEGTSGSGLHQLIDVNLVQSVEGNRLIVKNGAAGAPEKDDMCVFVTNQGNGLGGIINSSGNVAQEQYVLYRIQNCLREHDTTAVSVAMNDNRHGLDRVDDVVSGVVACVIVKQLAERDSIAMDSSSFVDESDVTYSVVSGNGPSGLADGNTYTLKKISDSRVKLENNGRHVTLNDGGDGTIMLSQIIANEDKDRIIVDGHGLTDDTLVTYCNMGNDDIPGLADGTSYYTADTRQDSFRLKTLLSDDVDITDTGESNHSFTVESGNADGYHTVSRQISPSNLELTSTHSYEYQRYENFEARERVVDGADALYFLAHGIKTGTEILYECTDQPIGGLSNAGVYFTGRIDDNYISVHPTYESSLANASNVSLDPSAANGTHSMQVRSIMRCNPLTDCVHATTGSSVISCPNSLEFWYRVGDDVAMEADNDPITLAVTSVSGNVISFDEAHGLGDGDHVVYGSGTAAGLSNGYMYYIRSSASNQVTLHATPDDAVSDQGAIALSDTSAESYGDLTHVPFANVLNTTVASLSSSSQIILSDAPDFTSAKTKLFRSTQVIPAMLSTVVHRGYDSGLLMYGFVQPYLQLCRQTKVYFTYQSGKSMQTSMSINFNSPIEVTRLSRMGKVATLTTNLPHNMTRTLVVMVAGASDDKWNVEYTISEIIDDHTICFVMNEADLPEDDIARGVLFLTVKSWANATVRAGMFDDQNGFYMEYNGTSLNIVRRNSVLQTPGQCTTENNSTKIIGKGTQFEETFTVRDSVVIRGQTYVVTHIVNDLELHVQPPYRGVSATGCVMTKTIETRVPQNEFNLDRLDGTGKSLYNLDVTKIQMIIIEYTWYGAGRAQVGVKGTNGEIVYAHQFIHNNHMLENFTRTGSLPVRFEINTGRYPTFLPSLHHWGVSAAIEGGYDQIRKVPLSYSSDKVIYTGMDVIPFQADTTSATLTYVHALPVQAVRITVDSMNYEIIKWASHGTIVTGTNVPPATVMVGTPVKTSAGGYFWLSGLPTGFHPADDLQLGYGDNAINYFSNLLSFRVVPSADNDRTGAVGEREVINRMMMILTRCQVNTTHDVSVDVVLNGTPSRYDFTRVGMTSFVEIMKHVQTDTVENGLVVFSFMARGGQADANGRNSYSTTTLDFPNTLPLTNCMLGGNGVFPDGPELITMRFRPSDLHDVSVKNPLRVFTSLDWYEQ
nr:virion structural protein-like protein [Oceanusvirus sp.]